MRVVENCQSCGLKFRNAEDRGGGVADNLFCRFCTDATGALRSYDAVLHDFTALIVRTQGLDGTEARDAAAEMMAQHPAWRRYSWVDRNAYPFDPKLAALELGRMHYVDEGAGPPVVFLHGTPSWSFEFRKMISALRETHRCIAPDLLGFGLSEKPEAFDHTIASHADAFEQFLDRLGLERFALYVHDFGGPIGLRFAERHPERIERLVISNSWMWPVNHERRFAWMSKLMATRLGRYLYTKRNFSVNVLLRSSWVNKATLTPEVFRHYQQPFSTVESRRATWTFARQLVEGTPFLEALWADREKLAALPTLLLWGASDPAFGQRELARFRATFPSAEVKAFPGVGHFLPEEAPDEVVAALRGFLTPSATPG